MLGFFATNARDRHHWTLNSCFGAFLFIRVHLRPFGYCTKLGAKWANLVQLKQKFVPQSLVRNSQNECSRSTYWTLSSCFHAFLSIWVHLGPFRYCTKLGAKWANLVQLMQEFVPQSLIRISRNGRSRSTQLDPKLMFSCVSFCLGAFGTIMLLHKLDAKHSKLHINAKVRATMSY